MRRKGDHCHVPARATVAQSFSPRPSRLGPLASALSPRPSLALAKAGLLISLAFLTLCLLCIRPVFADPSGYPGGGYPGSGGGWVPSDASGIPLQPGSHGLNNDGSANLLGTDKTPDTSNTYPIPPGEEEWWFGAYYPNQYADSTDPYSYGLTLGSSANNYTYCWWLWPGEVGTYSPQNGPGTHHPGEWPSGTTQPPDLNGSVTAHVEDTLTAYYAWTGPGPVPAHADFLLHTHVSATASVDKGSFPPDSDPPGALNGEATATLGSDTVTATAGWYSSKLPPAIDKVRLVQKTPQGGLVTLSLQGSVKTDCANSLPYGSWSGDNSNGGTSYYWPDSTKGTYGPTSGSASGTVSATASLPTGHWIGPYYFTNGSSYSTGTNYQNVPWPGNYDSPFTPNNPSDIPGANATFGISYSGTGNGDCGTSGTIIPVFFWVDPSANPPSSSPHPDQVTMQIAAHATASDQNISDRLGYDVTYQARDGIGDAPVYLNSEGTSNGSETVTVAVTPMFSSSQPDGVGGYEAIGPSIYLDASVSRDPLFSKQTPCTIDAEVGLAASLSY